MKQETLEEAAEKLYSVHINSILDKYDDGVTNVIGKEDINEDCRESFIEGAKWQEERMYSEAIEFAEWIRIKDFQTASKDNWIGLDMKYYTTEELFEQFKKKK